jgi:hypothetical protein
VAVHFVHVRKTGGSATKRALRVAGLPETPYGAIELHTHRFKLADVPAGEHVFFYVRDPIPRFMSGFYSRLHKGQPRYYFEWSPKERVIFEAFPTPQQLAGALVSEDPAERALAERGMREILHLRPMVRALDSPWRLRRRLRQIVYIGRQETLTRDWPTLRAVLGLPGDVELPKGAKSAHRKTGDLDMTLDEAAERALRDWYAHDYRLLAFCDKVRARRGWGAPDA